MQDSSLVLSLDWEDSLEKCMAIQSSTLAWRIPWRSLAGYSPWVCKKSDTTEWLTLSHFHICLFIPFLLSKIIEMAYIH